jgi:hypothetical protein
MRGLALPRIRYFKAYAFMAGLAVLVLGMTMVLARPPRPQPTPTVGWNPQWRCANQPEGDPICVRDLPPAAKPAPR